MLKRLQKTLFQGNTRSSIGLIILGTVVWSLTMVKSGLCWDAECASGVGFWGPNGHDGVWHLSVIESLVRGSWDMPVFAGETFKNYHLGFDLLVAWLHKLTFIPVVNLYFQIIPPALALFIGIFAYKFVYVWRRSKNQALWSTFFVYFGGSFGWIITLIKNGEIGGESLFWSQQSISTLINPPFALSILMIFLALIYLMKGLRSKSGSKRKRTFMVVTFLFGLLIQIKVYAGILALGGLFVAGFWQMIKRRGILVMKIFTGALIVSILLFFPIGTASETIVFKPFWFLETMMRFSDRLNWQKFGEAMVNYKLAGNWIKGVPAYTLAFLIFVTGNFGTRLVKDIWIFKKLKDFRNLYFVDVFIFAVIVAGVIIPMFYIQKGTPWNTIQFLYYSLMFSGILAGVWLGELLEQKRVENSIVLHSIIPIVLVLLTIPTTMGTLRHYLPARPPAMISKTELEALKFLSEQPQGIVLTYPFDQKAADAAVDNPPRSLYLYESTAYVSAFSKKPVYIEDEVNLEITGYSWRERRARVEGFFENPTKSFLSNNQISYIYLVRGRTQLGLSSIEIEKIFENNEVVIYKVI